MLRRASTARLLVLTIMAMVAASAHGGVGPDRPAGPPPARADQAGLRVQVDGGAPVEFFLVLEETDEGVRFAGTHRLDEEGCVVSYEWTADLDPRGGARLTGWIDIQNNTDAERAYELWLRFPLNPLVAERCRIGGTARLELVMDADGGRVGIPAGEAVWVAMVDEESVKSLHRGPFSMGGPVAGRAVADASFGAPYPSFDGPSIEDGLGIRHRCRLTGGDRVIFRSDLRLAGDPENFIRRRPSGPVRIEDRDERVVIDVAGKTKRGSARRGSVVRTGSRRTGSKGTVRITSGGD